MPRLVFSARLLTIGVLLAMLLALAVPALVYAMPQYAAATGQPCATCHVSPAGGGPRNAFGQRFEAIPTHSTDPLGAFRQLTQAQPTAAPTVAATAAPTVAATPAATVAATPRPAATALPAGTVAAPVATAAPPATAVTTADKGTTAAPTTLPRTGDVTLYILALGGGVLSLAGLALRKLGR
ncbi:MAG: hypothetical protein ACYC4L_19330 [Chloroflexota bacterium]